MSRSGVELLRLLDADVVVWFPGPNTAGFVVLLPELTAVQFVARLPALVAVKAGDWFSGMVLHQCGLASWLVAAEGTVGRPGL